MSIPLHLPQRRQDESFPSFFDRCIEHLGISNQKLAEVLEVHHTTVARWRKISTPEKPEIIKRFADFYRLSDAESKALFDSANFSVPTVSSTQESIANIASDGIGDSSRNVVNPFIVGLPVKRNQFFGRVNILRDLFNLWGGYPKQPIQSAFLHGERRIGKTSLLLQLRDLNLWNQGDIDDLFWRKDQIQFKQNVLPANQNYHFVYVDFQRPQMGYRKKLLEYLLAEMNLSEGKKYVLNEQDPLAEFSEIIIQQLKVPTIILMDEVTAAIQHPAKELDNYFWEALRAIATTTFDMARIGFVIATVENAKKLADFLGGNSISSPFFNIFGYQIGIEEFQEEEARALIQQAPISIPESEQKYILEQSQLYPFKIQILCRHYVDAYRNNAVNKWRTFYESTQEQEKEN